MAFFNGWGDLVTGARSHGGDDIAWRDTKSGVMFPRRVCHRNASVVCEPERSAILHADGFQRSKDSRTTERRWTRSGAASRISSVTSRRERYRGRTHQGLDYSWTRQGTRTQSVGGHFGIVAVESSTTMSHTVCCRGSIAAAQFWTQMTAVPLQGLKRWNDVRQLSFGRRNL